MKFKTDFFKLLNKLKKKENFSFVRYSDGEVLVMQNKKLVLADDHVQAGEVRHGFGYSSQDHKEFIPEKHGFVKDKLLESYKYKEENYFVGGICKNCDCPSREFVDWMHSEYGELDENYTYANLMVNSNYPLFVCYFVPELRHRKNVIICNEEADLSGLPFKVEKDFRVGKNCIVNDHNLIDDIREYISSNNIKDYVFLFSASSLSEILIHQLHEFNKDNTYVDVGTTLHTYLKLDPARDYLRAYWNSQPHPDLYKQCQ